MRDGAFDLIFTRLRRGSTAPRGEQIRTCQCGRHYQASTGLETACQPCLDARREVHRPALVTSIQFKRRAG
jgi:hypothetical protein